MRRLHVAVPFSLVSRDQATACDFDIEVAAAVLEHIGGGASMHKAARELEITTKVVYRWLASNSQFRDDYQTACREREQYRIDLADRLFEEAREIADDELVKHYVDEEGHMHPIPEAQLRVQIQKMQMQVDLRMKQAAKLNAKKYGDLIKSELSGPGGAPISYDVKDAKTDVLIEQLMAAGRGHVVDALRKDGVI